MGHRSGSARVLMLIVGIIALIFAIKLSQWDMIIEMLSKFNKYELAGYR